MIQLYEQLRAYLSEGNNLAVLGFIGTGVAVVAVAAWKVYVHFSNKNSALTEEKLEAILKRRDEEIRKEYAANPQDQEKRTLLERELAALEQKLANIKETIKETEKVHSSTVKLLDENLGENIPADQIAQAKKAIGEGNPALAESLLQKVVASRTQKAIEKDVPALSANRFSAKEVASGIQKAAEASYQLGLLAKDRVDFETAWQALTRAVQLAPDNALYLNSAGLMANTLAGYDKAIEYYEKALAADLNTYGPEHPKVATCWNNLGGTWNRKGQYDKAIEYHEKALASDLKTYGSEHPGVAISWNNLGSAWHEKGEYDKAIEYYEKAINSWQKSLGNDHPNVATGWNNLGLLWKDKGEHDKAIEYFEKALASNLKTYDPEHPYVATRWNNLGEAWKEKGQYDKAIEYYEKAVNSWQKSLGNDHPNAATGWNNLGTAWQGKGEYNKAIEYFEKALASDLKTFGSEHPDVAADWNNLGTAWINKGDDDKAIEYFEKALAVVKKTGLEHRVNLVEKNIEALRKKQ